MFAAQSLLAALGSIQFVTNLFFAKFINKETITKKAMIATVIIIIGNIIIVLFGSKKTQNYDFEELKDLLFAKPFVIYIIFITTAVIVLQAIYMYCSHLITNKYEKEGVEIPKLIIRFMPIAYAAVSAIIGTNSIIFGKVLSGLLSFVFRGDFTVFANFWTYIILAGFLVTMGFWLYRLNVALKKYDAMFIIPLLQCIWLLFGVFGGGIFFQEFQELSLLNGGLFALGIFILIVGIYFLQPNKKKLDNQTIEIEMGEIPTPSPSNDSTNTEESVEVPVEVTKSIPLAGPSPSLDENPASETDDVSSIQDTDSTVHSIVHNEEEYSQSEDIEMEVDIPEKTK